LYINVAERVANFKRRRDAAANISDILAAGTRVAQGVAGMGRGDENGSTATYGGTCGRFLRFNLYAT
jgi:hypothetical protein